MSTPIRAGRLSTPRLMMANLRHRSIASAALVAGVAVSTAIITGALLVGDSMRHSLRELTIQRLGTIQRIVSPGTFFDARRAADGGGVALMFFPGGSIETASVTRRDDPIRGDAPIRDDDAIRGGDAIRRAGGVQIIGIDDAFWKLGSGANDGSSPDHGVPSDDEIFLNRSLADELNVRVGDMVTVRLPNESAIPADSPLGRRDIGTEGLPRMRIGQIIPDEGLGRFSLSANQAAPLNAFLARDTVADVLDRDGQSNLLLLGPDADVGSDRTLADYGLNLKAVKIAFEDATIADYQTLTGERLILSDDVVDAVTQTIGGEVMLTYFANAIERLGDHDEVVAEVPYSAITAVDSFDALPLDYQTEAPSTVPDADDDTGENADGAVAIVINTYVAERLDADVGTPLRVAFYEPETDAGNEIERYFDAVVSQVVPITTPARPHRRRRPATYDTPPTVYNDPDLTPEVDGVTDAESIDDWDLPFPLVRDIAPEDDRYYQNHRLTPKAFIPYEAGRRFFGSRFGNATSVRLPAGTTAADVVDAIGDDAAGWTPIDLRKRQLDASGGTTPFDGLFLALSMFVMASAILLVAMLARLSLTVRRQSFGTLAAVGWTPGKIIRLVLAESAWLTLVGAMIGLGLGIWYAEYLIEGLTDRWVGAVTVPFLKFHATPRSMVIGALAGGLVTMLTIGWVARQFTRQSVVDLVRGDGGEEPAGRPASWSRRVPWVIAAAAAGLMVSVSSRGGMAAAGGFVGGGMLLLVATIWGLMNRLRSSDRGDASRTRSLPGLAVSTAARNPRRSILAVGLMAVAAFMIVAMGAFQLRPTETGTGGFDWVATASVPLARDLADADVRRSLLGPDADALSGATIAPLRRRLGQDAACTNLYRPSAPTVMAVRDDFEAPTAFDFSGPDDTTIGGLLDRPAAGTAPDPIPMVLDQNTAMWSLGLTGGVGQTASYDYDGETIHFEVAGLLKNSMLQGALIIGEANFKRSFPSISGDSYFLIDAPEERSDRIAAVLENRLGDVGVDVRRTDDVLAGLLAVQNTYLKTFQSLGALGLLLGTVGLAVAQFRGVHQRRGEFAVLRSIGFSDRRIGGLVIGETAMLLVIGIGAGIVCAVAALLPIAWRGDASTGLWDPLRNVALAMGFGLIVGAVAVIIAVRTPIVPALRRGDA